MSYPLAGETVTRTLRNVEFGGARPRDEPAPPEIAEAFRAMQEAFAEMGSAHQQWQADRGLAAWQAFCDATDYYNSMHNALLRKLRRHRDRCFVSDGCRFWLHVEAGGCRREIVRIEEV